MIKNQINQICSLILLQVFPGNRGVFLFQFTFAKVDVIVLEAKLDRGDNQMFKLLLLGGLENKSWVCS